MTSQWLFVFALHTVFQGNYGDISSRTALRRNLKCKSFDWYIKNIYPELFIPDQAIYSGEVSEICLLSVHSNVTVKYPIAWLLDVIVKKQLLAQCFASFTSERWEELEISWSCSHSVIWCCEQITHISKFLLASAKCSWSANVNKPQMLFLYYIDT